MKVETYGRNTLTIVDETSGTSQVYGSVGPDDADSLERFGRGRMHYARQFGSLYNYVFVLNQLQKRRARRVLHVGCGTDPLRGIMAENYCMAQEYVGVDLHLPNLRKALHVTNSIPARYLCQDLTKPLVWPDMHFDAVVALDVVEHMPTKEDGRRLVGELARLSYDLLIISTPSTPGGDEGVVRASDVHNYEFSPGELDEIALTYASDFRYAERFGFHMGEANYVELVKSDKTLAAIHEVVGARVGRGLAAMRYPEKANDVIMCFSNSEPISEPI